MALPIIPNARNVFHEADFGEQLTESIAPVPYDRLIKNVKQEYVLQPRNGVSSTGGISNDLYYRQDDPIKNGFIDFNESCVQWKLTLTDGTDAFARTDVASVEPSWAWVDQLRVLINGTVAITQNNFGQYFHDRILRYFSKEWIDTWGRIVGVIPNTSATTLGFEYSATAITADTTAGGGADAVEVQPATSYRYNGFPTISSGGILSMNTGAVLRNDMMATGPLVFACPLYVLHSCFENLSSFDPRIHSIELQFLNVSSPNTSYIKVASGTPTLTVTNCQLRLIINELNDQGIKYAQKIARSPESSVFPYIKALTFNKLLTNADTSVRVLHSSIQAPINHIAYFYNLSSTTAISAYIYDNCSVTKKVCQLGGSSIEDGTETYDYSTGNAVKPYRDLLRVLYMDNTKGGSSYLNYQNYCSIFPCQATRLSKCVKTPMGEAYCMDPTPKDIEITYTLTVPSATTYMQEIIETEDAIIISPEGVVSTLFNVGH